MGNKCSNDTTAAAAPAMDSTKRSKTLSIFQAQFTTNEHFLRDTVFLKLKMGGKLLRARQRIAQRNSSSNDGTNDDGNNSSPSSPTDAPSPLTENALKNAPVPSFSNFADPTAVKEKPTRETKIRDGIILIGQRMKNLGLAQVVMKDDGSCQFRSLAHQLRGDADKFHVEVRALVVDYMRKHQDEFSFLFESDAEFDRYLKGMATPGTWGDELTLKAASQVFNANIHVLTSEKEHYYVCYRSDAGVAAAAANNKEPEDSSKKPIDVFLAYISPIHYNSIVLSE